MIAVKVYMAQTKTNIGILVHMNNKMNTLGWFEGRSHLYPIQIYYEDTDFSGIVYHANYLRYFERGRSSFLNLLGIKHADLWTKLEIAFTIRKFEIEYKSPARIDEQIRIETTYDRITAARLLISQRCFKENTLITSAKCEAACISKLGKPIRVPKEIREKLKKYTIED